MNSEAPQLSTELLMLRAMERGLTLSDFEILTVGMIFDFIIEWNNQQYLANEPENNVRDAGQSDYDAF